MQTVIETPSLDRAAPAARIPGQRFSGLFRRHIAKGASAFQPGEPRQLYRVESGAICHYAQSAEGQHEIIEFAFPGDIIGLGCLATHVSTAKAMVETSVSAITDTDLEHALSNDNRLFFRVAEAREREFDYLREKSLNVGLLPPVQRVANFLLAIVSIDASEGRVPTIIADDISSGSVAAQLQMSIDTLASALLSLRRRGLVDLSDGCLRIPDVAALETMAAADG